MYRPGSFDALPKTQAIVRNETIVVTLHGVDTEKLSTRWFTNYHSRKPRHSPKPKPMERPTYC